MFMSVSDHLFLSGQKTILYKSFAKAWTVILMALVVSTILYGILFARFPTVDYVTHAVAFFLQCVLHTTFAGQIQFFDA